MLCENLGGLSWGCAGSTLPLSVGDRGRHHPDHEVLSRARAAQGITSRPGPLLAPGYRTWPRGTADQPRRCRRTVYAVQDLPAIAVAALMTPDHQFPTGVAFSAARLTAVLALVGCLEVRIVEVEADIGAGLPRTVLVGLPDSALYQARDRCKAAVSNSEQGCPISMLFHQPQPSHLAQCRQSLRRSNCSSGAWGAGCVFRSEGQRGIVLLGELRLDGRLRPGRAAVRARPLE